MLGVTRSSSVLATPREAPEADGGIALRLWQALRSTSIALRLALLLVGAYFILLVVNAAPLGHLNTGDTNVLVAGARTSLKCMHRGEWIGCGYIKGSDQTAVGPYPLLQYLPAMGMVESGLTNNQVVHALGSLNLAAFGASFLLVWAAARRLEPAIWGPVLILVLFGSSLTYQSTSGFGEMLAAFFVLAFVVSVLWRRPVLIVVSAVLATTGKETLFPFLLVLGLLAGRRREDGWIPPVAVWLPMVGGVAMGEFLNLGFNEFRFAVVKNLTYLQPIFRVPGLDRKLNFVAGIWFSPSSGVLWYWPLTVVLVLAVTIAALAMAIRWPRRIDVWLPPLLAVGVLVAFSAGLADWVSPFGWVTYGPRLMVPLLPGGLVVVLYTGGPLLAGLVRRLLTHPAGAGITGLGVAAAGWAQFGAPWTWLPAVWLLLKGSSGCPGMEKVTIQNASAARYYHCVQVVMWRLHPVVLKPAAIDGGGYAVAGRLLLAVASVALVGDVAGRVRRGRHARRTYPPRIREGSPTSGRE